MIKTLWQKFRRSAVFVYPMAFVVAIFVIFPVTIFLVAYSWITREDVFHDPGD